MQEQLKYRKKLKDIRLVIFDMDGLLLDTERIALIALERAFEKLGYKLNKDMALQRIGVSGDSSREFYLSRMGKDFPYDEIFRFRRNYIDEIISSHNNLLKEGALDLLDYLDALGLKKAVATSTYRERALKLLDMVGILHRFELVKGGDEVVKSKPEPEIYLTVCNELAIDKKDAIILEDSDVGALSAYRAGIKYILIPDLKMPSDKHRKNAYAVFDSLKELVGMFG